MSIKFSVSMCVYGGDDPSHFGAALDSIIRQTSPPDEIVLTVDGPIPDGLERVITRASAALEGTPIRLKVFRLARNMGHGEARRVCLSQCTNDIVALMDADDLSVENRFALQTAYLAAHPEVSSVGGSISEFIREPSNSVGLRRVPCSDREIKRYMRKRCPMNHVTVMFRRPDVERAGGYLDWYCDEDYYLWVRMALCGMRFGNVDEVLVHVRVGEDMYRRRGGLKYFKSEAKLQRFMLNKGMISFPRYLLNVMERIVIQVLLPNKLRGWVFRKLARKG